MDDSEWYPPMLDYNLPEDSDYIVNLTFEIRAMMLEMGGKNSGSRIVVILALGHAIPRH